MEIQPERITILNTKGIQKGTWVLYWMQQSQRVHDNPALEYAIHEANRLDLPVLVLFVLTDDYDHYTCLPEWAQNTLAEHATDRRAKVYERQELEKGLTHDPYWNAAMSEMRDTGFMHNYMRMYWGKKILEWSSSPRVAYETALYLNNRYFLDGRDPNSYAGIGWIFGLHDRAWFQREIFGKVRYMAASGLERKCDIGGYVDKVRRLQQK